MLATELLAAVDPLALAERAGEAFSKGPLTFSAGVFLVGFGIVLVLLIREKNAHLQTALMLAPLSQQMVALSDALRRLADTERHRAPRRQRALTPSVPPPKGAEGAP